MIRLENRAINTDRQGYLLDPDDWDQEVAVAMARLDGVDLSQPHWEIIDFLRAYYFEYAMAPPMRLLVKAVASRLGVERGNSRYLYRLFPDGPAKQACRYAGCEKSPGLGGHAELRPGASKSPSHQGCYAGRTRHALGNIDRQCRAPRW